MFHLYLPELTFDEASFPYQPTQPTPTAQSTSFTHVDIGPSLVSPTLNITPSPTSSTPVDSTSLNHSAHVDIGPRLVSPSLNNVGPLQFDTTPYVPHHLSPTPNNPLSTPLSPSLLSSSTNPTVVIDTPSSLDHVCSSLSPFPNPLLSPISPMSSLVPMPPTSTTDTTDTSPLSTSPSSPLDPSLLPNSPDTPNPPQF